MAQLYNKELTLKHYINNEKNKLFAEGGDYDDPSIIMFNICRNSQNGKIFTDFFSNLNYNFDKKFDFFKPNSQLNNDNLLIINGNGTRNAFNFSFVIDNFRLYLFKPGPEFRNNSHVNDVNYINNSFLDTLYYKIFVFIKFFTDDIIRIYQYQIKNISFENNIDFIKQKYFTFDKSIFGNKSYTYNFYVNKYLLLAKIIILNFKQDSNFLSITEYKIRGGGPQTNMNDNLIYK
jgi:hypothetical protein